MPVFRYDGLEIRSRSSARDAVERATRKLEGCGRQLRKPPPEPIGCCGRGCDGCVWEFYYRAVCRYCEDVEAACTVDG